MAITVGLRSCVGVSPICKFKSTSLYSIMAGLFCSSQSYWLIGLHSVTLGLSLSKSWLCFCFLLQGCFIFSEILEFRILANWACCSLKNQWKNLHLSFSWKPVLFEWHTIQHNFYNFLVLLIMMGCSSFTIWFYRWTIFRKKWCLSTIPSKGITILSPRSMSSFLAVRQMQYIV